MDRPALRLGAALVLLLIAAGAGSASAPLPLAPDVRDPVFAMLVAYVRADRFGLVTRDAVAQTLDGRGLRSRLPWQLAEELARTPGASDASATVTLRFSGPVDTLIPYHILWYHPGRIRASAACRFREWRLAELPFETPPDSRKGAPSPLVDLRLFALDEGELFVDIDGWLDALLGDALDDTWITGLAVARYRQREYGFAVGHNREGKSRIGVFDLSADSVVFPLPSDLRAANRAVRSEYERRVGKTPATPRAVTGAPYLPRIAATASRITATSAASRSLSRASLTRTGPASIRCSRTGSASRAEGPS
jgi:hypothetical protein